MTIDRSIRHYLDTHVDYRVDETTHALDTISIAYGYHYSGEHYLREQRFAVELSALTAKQQKLLLEVHGFLEARIPPLVTVRLPHATAVPRIRYGQLTFVAQDHRHSSILPVARLYYYEVIPELPSQIERQVRLESHDWSPPQAVVTRRLRAWVRAQAWRAYSEQVAGYLHA